jgi:hypothetical protein
VYILQYNIKIGAGLDVKYTKNTDEQVEETLDNPD